jgi:hypothetical protein
MKQYFLGDWNNIEDISHDFGEELDKDTKILLAWYDYADYSGSAYVLFERNGKLYEVVGSHCSCYSLDGQWEPEEVPVEALKHRIEKGRLGRYDRPVFVDEMQELLSLYQRRQKK